MTFGTVQAAHADLSGLTPCSESKGFAKRQKNEVKALKKRLAKVISSIVLDFPTSRMMALQYQYRKSDCTGELCSMRREAHLPSL